jgi:hypothetical protein
MQSPQIWQSELPEVDLLFFDKQTIAVSIPNAFLEGHNEIVPFTACEVFSHLDLNADVSSISFYLYPSDITSNSV